MQILLLTLAIALASAGFIPKPSEINGDWHTLAIAADNVEKIKEGGPLRTYLRSLECGDECRNMSMRFFVKQEGVCKSFSVVGEIDEATGVYVTDYSGKNNFSVIDNTRKIITLNNVNVDEAGRKTNMVLVAGNREILTEEELKTFVLLPRHGGVPVVNIQSVILTDTCPE